MSPMEEEALPDRTGTTAATEVPMSNSSSGKKPPLHSSIGDSRTPPLAASVGLDASAFSLDTPFSSSQCSGSMMREDDSALEVRYS